jgi:diguanylate cyclase (GGDEF)-like protein
MPSSFAVYTSSVPLLVAAVMAVAAFMFSFSFRYRRGSDQRLLFSYRTALLLSAIQLVGYSAVFNRLVEPTVLLRATLASLALYPSLILTFRRGFQRDPEPRGIPDIVALVIGAVLGGWVLLDGQTLLRSANLSPQGFLRISIGSGFTAFVTLVMSGIGLSLGWVHARTRGSSAKRQAKRFVGLGWVMILSLSVDFSVASLNVAFPPLVWIGTLGLIYAFLRDATENYSAAMQAFKQTATQHNELKQKFIRDPLTGLSTRTHGIDALEKILETSTASIVFVDLDHFKQWNDRFGHAIGDRVLVAVAEALKVSARVGDICARYAGDEFFVILQDAQLSQGVAVAHAIREELARIELIADMRVTASIGVTVARKGENADRAMNRADQLAYAAKFNGKNCVVSDTSTPPERTDTPLPVGR